MKKGKVFRTYPGCEKANVLDRIGMVIMLICFVMIVIATIGAITRLFPTPFNGTLLFIATYLGMVGYGFTAHATNVYIKHVKQQAQQRLAEEKGEKAQ